MDTLSTTAPPAEMQALGGELLIVIHGKDRGRPIWVMEAMLGYARMKRPDLAARLRVHETGGALPELDGVSAVLFYLADPLEAFFPACYAEAKAIADDARRRGIRTLQDPEALSETQKSRQTALWRAAGIRCAGSHAFTSADELRSLIETLDYPQILRDDLHHAQHSAVVVHSKAEALAIVEQMTYPGVALDFIDTTSPPGSSRRGEIYTRYFHKKRSFVFGPVVLNNHVFFSNEPIVGQSSSTFLEETHWKKRLARKLGFRSADFDATLKEDFDYFSSAPEEPLQMVQAVKALGLSMAALDYSVADDGSIVFWEANPYFSLPTRDSQKLLPKERRWNERIDRFYDGFVDWMDWELNGHGRHGAR
jgi:hypothetical protein